jgi:aminopeptidase-like protein
MPALPIDEREAGRRAYGLAQELFPICRSITGPGVRQTLSIIGREVPELTIHEIPSGTKCFDWTIPPEWSIRDAYIEGPDGERIVDFREHNLHVVGYSTPIDATMDLDELRPHLYSLPDLPDAIPYVTSYYTSRWGFCLPHRTLSALKPGRYRARIDSTLADGHLTYGEVILPGESSREIFISTYVCHPSMANNELSGPVATVEILRWLRSWQRRRCTVRALFVPETIGSVAYVSRNLAALRANVVAGFNVTCIGDERAYSYLPSRRGNTLADRAAIHALTHHAGSAGFARYSYLDRGSDERQYCSPGIDLPVASIMRSKYGTYPEYHTSLDDLAFVSADGLAGGIGALAKAIVAVDSNATYRTTVLGEPQLGKRNLYPTLGTSQGKRSVRHLMNVLAYADGERDLLALAELLGVPIWDLLPIVRELLAHALLAECDANDGKAGT